MDGVQLDIHSAYVFPEAELRAHFDHRSTLRKVGDFVLSLFRSMGYGLTYLWNSCWISNAEYDTCGEQKEWKANSQGLCVFLHGLRGHPSIWDSHRAELGQDLDCFIPFIPHKGNCSLEDAAAPILPTLLDYARVHPGLPICIFGVSRGGPLAMWLETQMREQAPQTPMHVATVAAVHYGTSIVNMLERLGLAPLFISTPLRRELAFGSERARTLLDAVRAPTNAVRSYHFSVGTEDFLYFSEIRSALPRLGKGEIRHVIHGHGHDSVVASVAHDHMTAAQNWRQTLS